MDDPGCICRGNWRAIVAAYESVLDGTFADASGRKYTLFGIVHASDDYYYGMKSETGSLRLLTCVGNLTDMGFTLIAMPRPDSARTLGIPSDDPDNAKTGG